MARDVRDLQPAREGRPSNIGDALKRCA
jgi:MtN3 and saliva related transmembrane protein